MMAFSDEPITKRPPGTRNMAGPGAVSVTTRPASQAGSGASRPWASAGSIVGSSSTDSGRRAAAAAVGALGGRGLHQATLSPSGEGPRLGHERDFSEPRAPARLG